MGLFIVFTIYIIILYAPTTHHADVNNIVTHQEPIISFENYKRLMGDVNPNTFTDKIINYKNPILFVGDTK